MKPKCGKKLLALLFTLAILSACIFLLSLPASAETVASGSCGTNLTYTLDSDGTLKIDGTGAMTNWDWASSVPWYSQRSQIKTVVIGDSVTGIVSSAFWDCSSLTSVTIGNSVTSIDEGAFCGCSSLTSVTIPDSVTSIGNYAFLDCSSLTAITVAAGNPSYCSIDGILYSADKTELILCPNGKTGYVTIPNSVTSIGHDAFSGCSSLTSVTIGNSVTGIGEAAFEGCTSLTSVTIGNSVTSIGSFAFEDCTSLTSVTIPDSVTGIGNHAFCICTSLTSVTIPDSVTSIGNYAFYGCSSLTSVTIPDSVTSIGRYAFDGCSKLQYNILDGAKYLGNAENPYAALIEATSTSITSCTVPDGTKLIADRAFAYCSSLTSVTLGDSVTSIGWYAFMNCTSLTSVTIPDSVTSIGGSTFDGCSSLTDIYCEATEQPADWDEDWLEGCTATVHWGWKGEESIPGDINGDKVLSIMDVTALLLELAKPVPGTENPTLFDVSGDSIISIQDVTKLLQMLAKQS